MSDPSSEQPPARRHRRVQRAGAPGTDPAPKVQEREQSRSGDTDNSPSWSSNDEQLRRDVPPHY